MYTARRKQEARVRWRNIAKRRTKFHGNTLGANFRKNFQKYQSFLKESTTQDDMDNEVNNIYINFGNSILFRNHVIRSAI